jgi:hypothetical protein
MKKLFITILVLLLFVSSANLQSKTSIGSDDKKFDKETCSCGKIPLRGKVKIVNSFPDFKVQVVSSFPDLKVKLVENFPDACGKWQIVDNFPDFTIQFVDNFPDFKIQFVENFPGVR